MTNTATHKPERLTPPLDTPIATRAARDMCRRAKTHAGTVAVARALGLTVSIQPLVDCISGAYVDDLIVLDNRMPPADVERVCGHELGHYWLQRHPSVQVPRGDVEGTCTAIGDALVSLCANYSQAGAA